MSKIYHIAALSENHVIGYRGKIPWRVMEDLKRFKEITIGHPVIMGRKTFQSLAKPLPDRLNVVITSKNALYKDGRPIISKEEGIKSLWVSESKKADVVLASSTKEALALTAHYHEVFIIGGGEIYFDSLPIADELRLTIVHQEVVGDVHYPPICEDTWSISFIEPHENYSFVDYVRKSKHL